MGKLAADWGSICRFTVSACKCLPPDPRMEQGRCALGIGIAIVRRHHIHAGGRDRCQDEPRPRYPADRTADDDTIAGRDYADPRIIGIGSGINDLRHDIAFGDAITWRVPMNDDAGPRRLEMGDGIDGGRFAKRRWQGVRRPRQYAAPYHELDQGRGISFGQHVRGIGLAAIFQCRGEAPVRHAKITRSPPGQVAGLIQRELTGHGDNTLVVKHHAALAQPAKLVGGHRVRHIRIHVDRAFVMRVQVQNVISFKRELQQCLAQARQFIGCRQRGRKFRKRLAGERLEGLRLIPRMARQPAAECSAQVREAAVEIAANTQISAPHMKRKHALGEPDRVRIGHDGRTAHEILRTALEHANEVMRHEHGRGLVGMERGLHIDMRPAPELAEAMHDEVTLRADTGCFQFNPCDLMGHDQFLSLGSGVRYEFQDARDLDGSHAGMPLTAASRALLLRLGRTASHIAPVAEPGPVTAPSAAGRKNVRVRQVLERLEQEGDPLCALVHVDAESDVHRAPEGALDGMILAIKDNAWVAGMPVGFGADPFFAEHATADAPVVARLRAAGAIILGKANMMEFAYGAAHPLRGETRNPRDPARTAGGSSGGTAAAIGAGLADGGFGTDTAGSIRLPASYCGIVGFKPSQGKVPMQGVLPLSPTLDHGGPMARDVASVARLFAVMSAQKPVLPERARCSFLVLDDYVGDANVTSEVRQAFEQGLVLLSAAGHDIRRLPPGRLTPPMSVVEGGLMIMGPEAAIVLERFEARAPSRLTTGTRAQIAEGFAMPASWYLRGQELRLAIAVEFEAHLQQADALLLPTAPFVAPLNTAQVGSSDDLAQMLMTIPFNMTGQPAITVPLPVGAGQMPVGLQLVGRKDDDAALLCVAVAAEQALARKSSSAVG